MQYNNLSKQYVYSSPQATTSFITSVYTKLVLAILAFVALEAAIFGIVGVERIVVFTQMNPKAVGIALIALCMVGPWIGNSMLANNPSRGAQYALLGFYIMLEAAIFLPILSVAATFFGPTLIWQACGLTASLFIALSAAVFVTRVDFSFLRAFLVFTGFAAIILIVAALLFGFELGMWFTIAMIFFACGYILYNTSQMINQADKDSDVLCVISLFTSVMTLFFYILRLLMELNRR